jgi:hypothetical protein
MRCIEVDSGTGALMATADTSCTGSQFVLLTQSELDFYTVSPFRLSVADGAAVSGLIIAVWVAAFYWRALVRALFSDADSTN